MLRHKLPSPLIRRRPLPIQQARPRRKQRPRAHGNKVLDLGEHLHEVVVHVRHGRVASRRAAGHEQHVQVQVLVVKGGPADDLGRVGRVEAVAHGGADDDVGVCGGDDGDGDVAVGGDKVEDLKGAVDIEEVDAGEGEDTPFLRDGRVVACLC